MRTSVGCEGGTRSTGRNCVKSLKTAAVFQTSSSILPSMTGGLSKRTRRAGATFSGVSSAASLAAEVPGAAVAPEEVAAGAAPLDAAGALVESDALESAGVDAGVGVGVGELAATS